MAIFRKIHTSFWSDSFTSELDKDKKLFYLYLLTNERTRQCGVYEITKRQISFDLGCSIDTVSKLLDYFIKKSKIKYNESTNELAIGNWLKYNGSTSPKVKSCIDKEFKLVKDTVLIEYVNSMDTHPQEEEEEEEEQEQEKEQENLPTSNVGSNEKSLYTLFVEAWFDSWNDYVFSKVDGAKIKNIIKQLQTFSKKNNVTTTDEDLLNYWKIIIERMPPFYKGKDLKTVDSKLNEIINELKNNKNGIKKQSKYAN